MASESSIPIDIASTIQGASIQRHPSPRHDLNPSTSASVKQPVKVDHDASAAIEDSDLADDEVPLSVLRPLRRRQTMPPLPDLRFEQSYLKSIEKAEGWSGVGWITFRDQIMLPLIQGLAWSLIVFGWRHMNNASKFSGASMGARIRRWWWGVNNWTVPDKRAAASIR